MTDSDTPPAGTQPATSPGAGFLAPYRVLDLSDHRGQIAGRTFAQLGADVVQVEPPGGSNGRRIGPFDDGGRSMYWAAYAAGKRSICLDDADPGDRRALLALVAAADFIVESRGPAEPARLSPAEIAAANPWAIHLLVSPFGMTGPKADWAATDLTLWAAGGPLLPTTLGDRPPMRIAVPQAWHHAAMDAVGGALVAHIARQASGRGQRVETAVQRSATQCTLSASLAPPIGHADYSIRPQYKGTKTKSVDMSGSGARTQRSKWPSRDGLLELHLAIGPAAGRFTNNFFAVMRERGALSEEFAGWDWMSIHHRIMADEVTQEAMEAMRAEVGAFLLNIGHEEAVELAISRKLLLAPVTTVADLAASRHLAARGFFRTATDAGGRSLALPGPFARTAAAGFADIPAAPALDGDGAAVRRDWLAEAPAGTAPPRPAAVAPAPAAPLAGLKVLDLAWVVAGPMIGRNLADFGATVVRMETAKRVDTARNMGPFPGGTFEPARSALFDNCNTGKLGLSLDLGRPEARAVVRDLAAWADVVVESFAPGQMDRWEIGYDVLRAGNPDLVMLSTSLMGHDGPWSALAGYGNIGAAMAGFQGLVGALDDLPIGPFGPYTDYIAPRFGLVVLLAALDARRRTGRGCRLDMSQSEAGMQFLASAFADFSATGRIARANANRDPDMAPHGVFPCLPDANGNPRWLALAVRDDAEWQRLAQAMGGAALAGDARFAALPDRQAHAAALEALVAGWTRDQEALALQDRLQALGLAAHIAANSEDLWADPQLQHLGHFVHQAHPLGPMTVEACRIALSATPAAPARPAPTVGGDNVQVLRGILGYDEARIAELAAAGALT